MGCNDSNCGEASMCFLSNKICLQMVVFFPLSSEAFVSCSGSRLHISDNRLSQWVLSSGLHDDFGVRKVGPGVLAVD